MQHSLHCLEHRWLRLFCTGGSQCRSDVLYSFDALYDCFLVASGFAAGMGVTPETFHVVDIPKLTIETGLKMVLSLLDVQ